MYAGPLPDIAVTESSSDSLSTHKTCPIDLKISEIIFPSEEIATKELEMRKSHRKKSTEEHEIKMVEEFVGPVLAQLSELK